MKATPIFDFKVAVRYAGKYMAKQDLAVDGGYRRYSTSQDVPATPEAKYKPLNKELLTKDEADRILRVHEIDRNKGRMKLEYYN
ncbi:MAG: hypothetical protein ACXAB2_11520 [Candidatus Hodarchaeales archaeon]